MSTILILFVLLLMLVHFLVSKTKVWPFKWKLLMSHIVCVITEKSSLAYKIYAEIVPTSKMTKDLCGLLQNDCNNIVSYHLVDHQ